MKLLLSLIIAISVLGLNACSRSKSYKQEQEYYRADSDFDSGRSSANGKIAKYGQPKKKVFVLPFMNDTPFSDDKLGISASNELLRLLKTSSRAVIPEDLRSADTSRDFYSGEKVRLSPLIREGKKLGVTLIVIGKIKKIKYRQKGDDVGLFRQKKSMSASEVEMRMFDTVEGKEVMFVTKVADSTSSQTGMFGKDTDNDPKEMREELVDEAVRNAVRLIGADIARALEKISWEGRIAKISGGKIYINSGRASGLNLGDILKVLTPGEDIYDPLTGAYMGRSTGQPKGTLEVTDFIGPDGAVTSIHSGGGFFESDVVQLY